MHALRRAYTACLLLGLVACGGGGSSSTPVSYTVTVLAGPNGFVSPASAVVPMGQTATFTLTPDEGFFIGEVSGCDGVLAGPIFTTGPVAGACQITVAFTPEVVLGWDAMEAEFTPVRSRVDPADVFPTRDTRGHASASFGETTYTVFLQEDGAQTRPYLLRTIGDDVRIWDEDSSSFVSNLSIGDTIGHGGAGASASGVPAIGTDTLGNVYIAYVHGDNTPDDHVYLNRYNASTGDVEIWDGDSAAWSSTLSDAADAGDGIDAGRDTTQAASGLSLVINGNNDVFITYIQNSDAFLTRYNAGSGTVEAWDGDASAFTTTLTDGDSSNNDLIAQLTADACREVTSVVAGSHVYFATVQNENDAQDDTRIALSRYNATTDRIERWDAGGSVFSSTLTDGNDDTDFVSAGSSGTNDGDDAGAPALSYESVNGDVYLVYEMEIQAAANQTHLLMSRFNGTTVQYWNDDAMAWSTTPNDGDDLADTVSAGATNKEGTNARLAHAANGDLYITYLLENATSNLNHVYMSRYDASAVSLEHWDSAAMGWDPDKADGDEDEDAIDDSTPTTIMSAGIDVVMANTGDLYVAYAQDLQGSTNAHMKLSRYNATLGVMEVWSNTDAAFVATQTSASPIDEPTPSNVVPAWFAPSIAQLSSGELIISYTQQRLDIAPGAVHLQLAKVLVDP